MLSYIDRKARIAGVFVWMVLSCSVCWPADEPITPAALLKEATQAMEAGRYDDAVATMYIYLDAVDESKAPRVVAIAQEIRFKLATILIKEQRLDEAAAVLQEYIDGPLAKFPRQARKMLATCLYETGDFEGCVVAVTNALYYNANPVVVEKKIVKDKDDEEDYSSFEDSEPEPEYTQDELIMLHLTLGEAYFGLGKWEECIEPFTFVIENTPNEQRKGYAIMQVINALIEIPDFARITAWIPQLYRTTARFDIRVNLALMNAAAALYDAAEYDSALPLYRMILPREELVAYQQSKLRDLRIAAGLPPVEGLEMTAGEQLLFGSADLREAASEEKNAGDGLLVDKPKELVDLENLIITLQNLPPYETDIEYRMANLYKEVQRYWEGVKFFDIVYATDPGGELGERSVYELVDTLLNDLDEQSEAEQRGFAHMAKYKEGMTPRQIAYLLTGYYQKHETMPSIKTLLPYLDGFVRTDDEAIVKYDAELYFMQAVADLVMLNYEAAERSFKRVLDEFPGSHQEGNALYWYGMSKLFLLKYAEAWPDFEKYVSQFATESWVDEASFQGGICLFGMEKYDEALERFSLVIKNYPNSSIFPEACSMRGDIYGSRGLLDEAIADYRTAIAHALKPAQATYAVFQMAEVFEAEDRYEEIIEVVQAYLDRWDTEADIAKALFWLGKTKIQQERFDEAVATYLGAIVKFGTDVRQDGVDMMIAELVKVSAIWLDTEAQNKLTNDLQAALDATDDLTLKLRLRVTMAKLNKTETELGTQLLSELPDLENASPPVLAAMCDASFEMQDYSRAEELLRIFIIKFEDSDYMRAAYKLRGYGQYAEKDYEGTLKTIEEAQETYGTDHDVAWAQLMKAQVLLDMGRIDDARAANMSILSVPAWRGEPVAQATYQLGQVEEKNQDPRKAFGFYQRTYFQYKGHAGGYWAAEAYLASARCLKQIGLENDRRNTYRAMLFDPYVNTLPQAAEAREALGASEVAEIAALMEEGTTTNITIAVEGEVIEADATGEGV